MPQKILLSRCPTEKWPKVTHSLGRRAKRTTKKIQAKFIAKRRQEVAKKYRLDLQTLDLIELMGRTNGW